MKQYNFLQDEWNGSPKTVWSRKKQNKLFKLLIKKYPTAKDLRKKLFQINTEDSVKLGHYINPKWDYEQYYRFITSNIIKYSSAGKIILSQLIGAAIGTGVWIGTSKYLQRGLSDYDKTLANLGPEEQLRLGANCNDEISLNNLGTEIARAERVANSVGYSHNMQKYVPFVSGLGTKSLSRYGIYSILDKLDK